MTLATFSSSMATIPNKSAYVRCALNFFPLLVWWEDQTLFFNSSSPALSQALCTLGNGYFATRGCLDECRADADEHYPGTYMARGWNREISVVEGRDVENEVSQIVAS